MKWKLVCVTLLLLGSFTFTLRRAHAAADLPNPYIVRLTIEGCEQSPAIRRQTGFLVAEMVGVVTALHGIVDCTTIGAVSADGKITWGQMALRAVDIERDVAVLWSPDLDLAQLDGLQPSPVAPSALVGEALQIVGYPFGLASQATTVVTTVRALEPLNALIPVDDLYTDFVRRESPAIDREVFNLATVLEPGLAGAPILDDAGRLVGVSGGGLRDGTLARSWGFPWTALALQPIDLPATQAALDRLATLDLAQSFGFAGTHPIPPDGDGGFLYYTVHVVDEQDAPIADAAITLSYPHGYEVHRSDADGFYVFWLPKGMDYSESVLLVEAADYQMVSRPL
ncbi:MAG: trypsin-like peptidase domain-containing protein, partial [Caldilineaceae bacterium]|nr:trypsin-like peptidase domain-containing protein [Caldilineaceae bacterium]